MVGPIASADVCHLLSAADGSLPLGYVGAPLMATLIKAMLNRGHRVTGISTSTDLPLRFDAAVTVHARNQDLRYTQVWCPMRPRAWPFNGSLPGRIVDLYGFEREALQLAIRASGADVVHAHWAYEFAWAALRSGLPHVVTCHDSPEAVARLQPNWRRSVYRWLRAGMARHVMRHAEHVTAVSPYMVDQVQHLCKRPVAMVPNPIPDWLFDQTPEDQPGRQRVLMVSNGWGPLKNQQIALRAFAATRHMRPQAELVTLGTDFEPGGAAERWCVSAGIQSGVRFVGSVPHRDVVGWMCRSDVLLNPSLEESFGAVLAEALVAGLAVVAGQSSGAVPWLVGTHGRLLDVTDQQALSSALCDLLDDPGLRYAMMRGAREEMSTRFGSDAVAASYEAKLVQACAQQASTDHSHATS